PVDLRLLFRYARHLRVAVLNKNGFPAKAGTHRSAPEPAEEWVPAFAGTPDIGRMKPRTLRRCAGSGVANVAALLGDAELLVADLGEGGDALADLLLRRQCETQAQPRLRAISVDRPFRPWIERDARLQRRLHELSHIDLVRQFHPQIDAAFRQPWLARRAELALH